MGIHFRSDILIAELAEEFVGVSLIGIFIAEFYWLGLVGWALQVILLWVRSYEGLQFRAENIEVCRRSWTMLDWSSQYTRELLTSS